MLTYAEVITLPCISTATVSAHFLHISECLLKCCQNSGKIYTLISVSFSLSMPFQNPLKMVSTDSISNDILRSSSCLFHHSPAPAPKHSKYNWAGFLWSPCKFTFTPQNTEMLQWYNKGSINFHLQEFAYFLSFICLSSFLLLDVQNSFQKLNHPSLILSVQF